jgi:Fe-S-cluster containining protein
MTAQTTKEAIWLACKPKTCCHTAIVVPSGRDVWRISRTLDAPPWSFLKYFPGSADRPDSFALDRSETTFRLVLAKPTSKRTKTEAPCIFLLRTRLGHHRCGLGALRPAVCSSFPSELVSGVLCVRNDAGCTCRTWALADVNLDEETAQVTVRQAEAIEYHQIVARWNAVVGEASPSTRIDFIAYCEFLLRAYDDLAARAL